MLLLVNDYRLTGLHRQSGWKQDSISEMSHGRAPHCKHGSRIMADALTDILRMRSTCVAIWSIVLTCRGVVSDAIFPLGILTRSCFLCLPPTKPTKSTKATAPVATPPWTSSCACSCACASVCFYFSSAFSLFYPFFSWELTLERSAEVGVAAAPPRG